MKKSLSLLRASLSEGMRLFRVGRIRGKRKEWGWLVLALLTLSIGGSIFLQTWMLFKEINNTSANLALLIACIISISLLTFLEGVYKAQGLLFNCRDDNLVLALPIKKGEVLAVRMLKLYLFELAFMSLFLIPIVVAYAISAAVGPIYYIVSIIALIMFPLVPVMLACAVGGMIMQFAVKTKFKNIMQVILTGVIFVVVMYLSYNLEDLVKQLTANSVRFSELVMNWYYPAGAYMKLVEQFSWLELAKFVGIHLLLSYVFVKLLAKVYFKINSQTKAVRTSRQKTQQELKIRSRSQTWSLIGKEWNKIFSTPVLLINAGFSVALWVLVCGMLSFNYEGVVGWLAELGTEGMFEPVKLIEEHLAIILFLLACATALMTLLTVGMISLERETINLLKSLPISSRKIIGAKVLAAVILVLPIIWVGELVVVIRFGLSWTEAILTALTAGVVLVLIELIGIMADLQHPKLKALSDTEVVKQNVSVLIVELIGIGLVMLAIGVAVKMITSGVANELVMLTELGMFSLMLIGVSIYVARTSEKRFKALSV